jgi:hypothetical protein
VSDITASNALVSTVSFYAAALQRSEERYQQLLTMARAVKRGDAVVRAAVEFFENNGDPEVWERAIGVDVGNYRRLARAIDEYRRGTTTIDGGAPAARPGEVGAVEPAGSAARDG